MLRHTSQFATHLSQGSGTEPFEPMPSAFPPPARAVPTAPELQSARHRFFSGAGVPENAVPASILRSWTRCMGRGQPSVSQISEGPMTAYELRILRERHEDLRHRCRPELETLHASARSTGSIVILTDPNGLVLDTVGSADFADKAARVTLQPGADWSEAARGTNAIGTALLERRAIEVHGAEHFAEPHGILSCAGAPILNPRGELAGLLDLSGPASINHLHALALVRLAVTHVEHRMFENAFAGHDVVRVHSDPHFLGTPREGVLVFADHKLVAANRPALALLGLGWDALDMQRFSDLFDGSLSRTGDVRQVRSSAGNTLHMRVERRVDTGMVRSSTRTASTPSPVANTPVPALPAETRPAVHHPAPLPDAPAPCFDAQTAKSLTRAVRLLDAGVPVLVQGETGTGKEVFARHMHRGSTRAHAPFAAVNCAALPEGLIESELFGYEDGAFTGARRSGFKGLLREADGGVLFLDEIGDMPLALQTRLLRVLQEREVMPLGGARAVPVDFQLICASHRDLQALVESGAFRADLYFRIAQYTVALPALRTLPDREELVMRFWGEMAGHDATAPRLSKACLARLAAYEWPGNFRQFIGTLRVLRALAEPGDELDIDALPSDVRGGFQPPSPIRERAIGTDALPASAHTSRVARTTSSIPAETDLGTITLAAMTDALAACHGNISRAAKQLGIHRSTLHRHLAAAGLKNT